MIAGTSFRFHAPELVSKACQGLRPTIGAPSEVDEIQAECESQRAACLACEDCMIVFDIRPNGEALEMFIWLLVAFRHGAVERQTAAVLTIARDIGASTVAFYSRRRGWARRLGPEWRPRGTLEFVRRV